MSDIDVSRLSHDNRLICKANIHDMSDIDGSRLSHDN